MPATLETRLVWLKAPVLYSVPFESLIVTVIAYIGIQLTARFQWLLATIEYVIVTVFALEFIIPAWVTLLAILFLGIGDQPAVALIFLSGLWPLLINTIFGVRGIERTLIKVARAARAGEWLVMCDIVLPASLPAIFTGLRLAVGAGWLTVVTAEMIAVKSGLGYMILNAQLTFRSDLIVAGIVVIGAVGLLADQLVRLVRARICRWQEGLTAAAE